MVGLELLVYSAVTAAVAGGWVRPEPLSIDSKVEIEQVCELAREISETGPCLEPGDCDAYDLWQKFGGEPGLRKLTRGSRSQPRLSPPRLNCLAQNETAKGASWWRER